MANIIQQSISVSPTGTGEVLVRHVEVHDDGIDMGGELVLEVSNAAWLADKALEAADAWGFARLEQPMAPDHFIVYVGGSDWQPFVHIHNLRGAAPRHGKTFTLAMTTDLARQLGEDLKALADA
ncbi:MAG TPA: hypothetical protein PK095_13890 [Myxococcota bacterium]|nr:hypothetical protein [Myxococcota bacterium]